MALAERKLAAGTDVVEEPGPEGTGEAAIIDLMQVLEQALARPETGETG